jgi:hypothetical protein
MNDNRCGGGAGSVWIVLALLGLQLVTSVTTRAQEAAEPEREPAPTSAPDTPSTAYLLSAKLDVGVAFGFQKLPNRPLEGGDGIALALGASTAPLWVSWLGVGGGADLGIKYTAVQATNGGYALRRWPLALHADFLAQVSTSTLLRIAAGPYLELGVEILRTGRDAATDRKLPHALGYLLEGGIRQRVGKRFALDASLRWTGLSYEDSARSDASSLGVFVAIHFILL